MPEQLIPGAPPETGTYFAVVKLYTTEDPQRCVLHYQKHKELYLAVGHAFSVEVQASDVVGYVGEAPLIKMEDIKYGQLWARHSKLVEINQVGAYRISFEGLKKAVEEAVSVQRIAENTAWVKPALQWAKEAIEFANKEFECPQPLVETWGNMFMNCLHSIDQALDECTALKEGNKEREVEGGAFSKWILDNGFTRTQSHDGKEWWWHDYTGRYGQCNYTATELFNEWNNQQNKQ